MFLHIGENIAIQKKDIIAIIDKESINNSKDMNAFMENLTKNGHIYNNNTDIKTYIITCVKKLDRRNRRYIEEYCLYTSNISSTTLCNRNEINI